MTLDLKVLREKAEKAQGNPLYAALVGRSSNISWPELCAQHGLRTDLAHIAAACPANVLALIARCERAEALLGEARDALRPFATLAQEQITEEYRNAGAGEHGCVEVYDSAEISANFKDCDRARATLARIDAAMGAGGEG